MTRFPRSRTERDRLSWDLRLPAPDPIDLATDFGRFRVRWTRDGTRLAWERELSIDRRHVDVSRADEYEKFLGRVAESDRTAFAFRVRAPE